MRLTHLFTAALALMASMTVSAEEFITGLKIDKTDGTADTYLFTEQPQITFNGRRMIVKTDEASTSYSIKNVEEFKFVQISGIEDVAADEVRFVALAPGQMAIISQQPVTGVSVYDAQGRAVGASVTTEGTTTHVDLTGLASGVYIINANNQSIKIVR